MKKIRKGVYEDAGITYTSREAWITAIGERVQRQRREGEVRPLNLNNPRGASNERS